MRSVCHACFMAGITLTQAQTNLQQWIDAQADVSPDRSVTVEDGDGASRSVTSHDLEQIMKMIDYWQRMVVRLSRGSGISVGRMIVND